MRPLYMEKAKLFVISAPSGAGKTTLVTRLLQHFDCFSFSISATTRAPRGKEQDGVDYYFLPEEKFRRKIAEGAFLEYEEVYPGRLYGTLKVEVDRILKKGRFPIFDVDVVGGLNIKRQYASEAVAIFIKPPNMDILYQRLQGRGTESPEEVKRRFDKAAYEMTFADQFDHILVNDDLDRAVAELRNLVSPHVGVKQDV